MKFYHKAVVRELEASRGERRITTFLKRNPLLVVQVFNSASNTILVCPEFRFGNRHRADFVVLSGYSNGWEVHLVELEPVGETFFLADGTETKTLRKAKKQISDWHHYIQTHPDEFREELSESIVNRNIFRSRFNHLNQHHKPEIIDRKYNFRVFYYIVIGRRSELSTEDTERRSYYYEFNRCELLTYDRFIDKAMRLDEAQKEIDRGRKEYAVKKLAQRSRPQHA